MPNPRQSTVTIEHVKGLQGHEVVAFLTRASMDLLDRGFGRPSDIAVNWSEEAFVAYDRKQIVGAISYSVSDWDKSLGIHIGYVAESYRGRGLYRSLWQKVVEKAQELGYREIVGASDPYNKLIAEVNAKLGRRVKAIYYTFDVPMKENSMQKVRPGGPPPGYRHPKPVKVPKKKSR